MGSVTTDVVPTEEIIRARLRPSVLPMLDACSWFLPGPDTPDKEVGRDRHAAWVALCKGDESLVELLDADDAEGVRWAADYFKLEAPHMEWEPQFERTLNVMDDNFCLLFPKGGTPDCICGPAVFDLKWRPRDYYPQMAAYALMAMEIADVAFAWVHVLYGATRTVKKLEFSQEHAWNVIQGVLRNVEGRPAAVCDYCGWCERRLTCSAFNAPAIAVANGREDWGMETYHLSQITNPDDMAMAIKLSAHLRKWCDGVDHFKREWALKQGIKIPGYRVREEKGDREITDLNEAARLSGIPVEKFIQACSVGIGELKKVWAEHHQVSLSQADKEINSRLAPVIKRVPTLSVVKEKEPKTKE